MLAEAWFAAGNDFRAKAAPSGGAKAVGLLARLCLAGFA
jgi:hypothetical protein